MENKKVSIIIPVYKVEKYIEECLESLRNQTYTNLEIILCDDESPDRCPEICERYAQMDSRFKVLHKKNGGAASARNMGLDIATGDYLGFVDSDDVVKEDYIEKLVGLLEENDADIAVCAFTNLFVNTEKYVEMENTGDYSQVQYLERFLQDWKCGLIWNKLFKKELLGDIRFAEGHVIDDEFFTYRLVMNAKKVIVCDLPLYRYRMRKSGVMNQGRQKKMLKDRMEYFPERFEVVTEKYPQLYAKYLENLSDNIIRFAREAKALGTKEAKRLQKKYLGKVLRGPVYWKLKYAYLKEMLWRKAARIGEKQGREDVFYE